MLADDTSLAALQPLALDAQATGAAPPAAALLELAWAPLDPASPWLPHPPEAWLVEGVTDLPPRVVALTGITPARYAAGPRLHAEALQARLEGALAAHPLLIIHYARFERPFLAPLLGDGPEILCTWELARRLLPDLPRRGLRPLAGFLGHPVGELKRSADFVHATAAIWHHLLLRLRDERGLTTLGGLRALLQDKAPRPNPAQRLVPLQRQERLELPATPGVYHLCDAQGRVLYVGKATSLKARVNTYFQGRRRAAHKDLELVAQVWSVTPHPTATPLEAALLEVDHIRALAPPYNVALRAGEERLWFASLTLRALQEAPDRRHPLGPFTSPWAPRFVTGLLDLLGADAPAADALLRLLAVPAPWAPAPEVAWAGLAAWRQRRGQPRGLEALLAQARLLARERAAAEPDEDEDAGEDEGTPGGDVTAWTPEAVADLLDDHLLHAAQRVQRARALPLLADAAVGWLPRNRRTQRRALRLALGAPAERADDGDLPPSPQRPHLQRLCALTPGDVARLDVLAAELRALLRRGRAPTLGLSTGRRLEDAGGLALLLGEASRRREV